MLQIQLYVENDQGVLEEVELYKDESVTLTQSIQDIMDIEKVFTDYSKTFNVPASKTNNKFFKHFYNYHIDGFDARRKKNAELHLNYKPFKKGKIKLEGSQLKNNEPHTYKLTFFGNTVTLKDLIGEDKLGNLTYLDTAFSFQYNDTNIESLMTDGLDGQIGAFNIEEGVVIPLITHTDRLIYDSSDTTAGTNNIYYSILDTNVRGVNFNQLKPAIRLYAIIKAIEKKYQIEFSEDFFSETNLSFYNLYMWLHAKEGSLFDDQDAQYTVDGFSNVRGDTNNITGVHTSFFTNTYDESKAERKIRVKVTPSSNDEYSLVIKQNGEEFKKFSGLTGTTTNGTSNNIEEIQIPNGDYTFFIESENAATFSIDVTIIQTGGGFLGLRGQKQITFTGSAGVLTDELLNITSNLPKMKTLDFLTGIFKMFNLTSFVDDNGTIVVKTLDSFFASSTNTWDITKHLDKEESIVDSVIPYRQVNLGYKGTDTFLAKNHENLANKKWGTLEFAKTDNFEGDAYNIELPFEHMKFEHLRDAADGTTQTNIQWGWSVDTKQESTIGDPLIFYVGRPIASIAAVNLAGSRVNISSPRVPSNSLQLTNLFGDQSQSLNFHGEFDEYTEIPNNNTLFESFYKEYVEDLFDKQKRLTFVSAYLPMSITEQLSLADKIIIFDNLYRINKITTNFETNKSDLELTNILEEKTFNVNPLEINVDLSNDIITADSSILTADIGNILADGFTIIGTPEVPSEIESNEVSPPTSQPCVVTAATIGSEVSVSGCDNIIFRTTILTKGTLCGTEQIDEFGFLLSSTESDLTASDDIDTLKADSNIQVVPVIRQTGSPSLTSGQKTTTKTGLTDPATHYARFYVRTNTSDLYAFADVISDVFSETTSCGEFSTGDSTQITVDNTVLTADVGDTDGDGTPEAQVSNAFLTLSAGTGDTTGYSSIPTLAQIDAKQATTQAAGRCGETLLFGTMYHNGDGDVPVIGDSIKMTFNSNYAGGYGSFPQIIGPPATSNDYGAFAFGSTADGTFVSGSRYNLEVTKYLVFQWSTAKVVAIYNCP